MIADSTLLMDPATARLMRRRRPSRSDISAIPKPIAYRRGQGRGGPVKPISRRDLFQTVHDILNGVSPAQRARAEAQAETALPKFPRHLVLVADDNPVNREVIIETLRRFDLPCDTVADGRAALNAVQAKRYDLVFMDGSMPEMDGFESARAIRLWSGKRVAPHCRSSRSPRMSSAATPMPGRIRA